MAQNEIVSKFEEEYINRSQKQKILKFKNLSYSRKLIEATKEQEQEEN